MKTSRARPASKTRQSVSHSYTDETHAVLSTGSELLAGTRGSSARRSLDYVDNVAVQGSLETSRADGNEINREHTVDDSETGGPNKVVVDVVNVSGNMEHLIPGVKKHVHIISPHSEKPQDRLLSDKMASPPAIGSTTSLYRTPLSSPITNNVHSIPPQSRAGTPSSVENHARVVQYLVGELKALLGNVGTLKFPVTPSPPLPPHSTPWENMIV